MTASRAEAVQVEEADVPIAQALDEATLRGVLPDRMCLEGWHVLHRFLEEYRREVPGRSPCVKLAVGGNSQAEVASGTAAEEPWELG